MKKLIAALIVGFIAYCAVTSIRATVAANREAAKRAVQDGSEEEKNQEETEETEETVEEEN